jgi:hypothetical protein
MSEAEHSGRCLCGAIRYRASGAPKWIANCHCASCRRATGSPFTTYAGFAAEVFAYLVGEPVRFQSSPGVTRSFLRAVRHAAHLRGRALARRGARAGRHDGPAGGLAARGRRFRRGEAALGAAERPATPMNAVALAARARSGPMRIDPRAR